MIPSKIHLTVKNKSNLLLQCQELLKQISCFHPDWDIEIYDDEDALKIVQTNYPEWVELYKKFPNNIQRMDVFRLIAVYLFGGFYMDADMVLITPLHDLLNNILVLAEEKTLTLGECVSLQNKDALRIANYMFASVANHPFIFELINAALQNSSKNVVVENDILESTGPGLLSTFYHDKKQFFAEILLLENSQLHCRKKCCLQPSCHFGHYAAHLHEGSWRWQ